MMVSATVIREADLAYNADSVFFALAAHKTENIAPRKLPWRPRELDGTQALTLVNKLRLHR